MESLGIVDGESRHRRCFVFTIVDAFAFTIVDVIGDIVNLPKSQHISINSGLSPEEPQANGHTNLWGQPKRDHAVPTHSPDEPNIDRRLAAF